MTPAPPMLSPPTFQVVPSSAVTDILAELGGRSIDVIARTYLDHAEGLTVNPDSQFLRFPGRPAARIIALPASINRPDMSVLGVKWISSFPGNHAHGLPRASAVLILNDHETGFPYAVLEGAQISAARTSASAVLGARWLACNGDLRTARSISFNGAGVIARSIIDMFAADGWSFNHVLLHDINPTAADALCNYVEMNHRFKVSTASKNDARQAEIVVYTTTAVTPHVPATITFKPEQTLLHISLRDLAPEIIYSADNYFDDVEHCMKADTSPHLAVQAFGDRSFVGGTIADVMKGRVRPSRDRPVVFSPFGMGILDLALGYEIYSRASMAGKTIEVREFF